jgi:type VI secretion system secreted protein VgrG
VGAQAEEALSEIPRMRMEFVSKDAKFDPGSIIGKRIKLETEQGFSWSGLVVQVEDLGLMAGGDVYAAELRPWLWVSTIGEENRIYQNLTTAQIVEDVLKPLGGTIDVGVTTPTREYCVQYKESDFAFISRLLEEDGVHYYFDYSGAVEKMVLSTDIMTGIDKGTIPFTEANISAYSRADRDTIYEWSTRDRAASGKVTVWDYDFTKSNTPLSATSATAAQPHGQIERYQSGGHFTTSDAGTTLARIAAEGHAAEVKRATGLTNHADVRVGHRFKLKYPDRQAVEGTYAVIKARHYVRFDDGAEGTELSRINRNAQSIHFPEGMKLYETEFEVQPAEIAYQPPKKTPWPEVPALLTALVTGPSGEEIHTDKYGRIKVQFPWDRKGKKDEKTTCWVRTVMPWTGKGYGIVAIPRMGMEVVIQFERGNIDRPICTGMLYNSANMPPYGLPGEMNRFVIRTQSTKQGGASNFHELSFDDTKGKELTYFQSEKNYKELVKANAQINIGGSLTQVVHVNTSETVETGERTLDVQAGSETTTIAKDQNHTIGENRIWEVGIDDNLKVGANRTQEIGGNHSETIGGDSSKTIGGALSVTVGSDVTVNHGANETTAISGDRVHSVGGAHAQTVGGDQSVAIGAKQQVDVSDSQTVVIGSSQELTVGSTQDIAVGSSSVLDIGSSYGVTTGTSTKIKAGTSITLEANVSIELKVGASKIKIDPSGVTIEGPMIQVKGTAMLMAEAPLVQTKASGILILKGGVTMIN